MAFRKIVNGNTASKSTDLLTLTNNFSTLTNNFSTLDNSLSDLNAFVSGDSSGVLKGVFIAGCFRSSAGYYSEDAETWTQFAFSSSNDWREISIEDGVAVAMGDSGSPNTSVSLDGTNWVDGQHRSWTGTAAAYGNGLLVVPGRSSTRVSVSSNNGASWTVYNSLPSSNARAIAYGAGRFVVLDSSGNAAWSVNGATWTSATMPTALYNGVIFADNKFVAVSDTLFAYSSDGVSWSSYTAPVNQVYDLSYANGRFVGLRYNTATAIVSSDGITWSTISLPVSDRWIQITHGDGKFVAVSSSKIVVSSDFGNSWTVSYVYGPQLLSVSYGLLKNYSVSLLDAVNNITKVQLK